MEKKIDNPCFEEMQLKGEIHRVADIAQLFAKFASWGNETSQRPVRWRRAGKNSMNTARAER